MKKKGYIPYSVNISIVAMTFVVATVVYSCSDKIGNVSNIRRSSKIPTQTVQDMTVQQSENGLPRMRMSAPLMERYDKVNEPYDVFPQGIKVKAYTPEGLLETEIIADGAKHITNGTQEKWIAYGHVVIKNFIKGETMTTDTIYWDRANKRIYTNCLVKIQSPDMFMQGLGMESDERASNAKILKPFDSYGVISRDTASIYIDSANFIGPVLRKGIKQK